MARLWKPDRGKLGALSPLLGSWRAEADSPRGPLVCERRFMLELDGKYLRLDARWQFGGTLGYTELALFGVAADGVLGFWSFTSDGKQSQGRRAEPTGLPDEAIAFEAEMPAGLARQAYWPNPDGSIGYAVEARNAKGWKRFLEHRYLRVDGG
jgi:hypothetical protein